MSKNIIYFLVALALAVAVYFFVFKENNNFISKDEANFTIKDTASISTIFLSSMQGKNIKLHKTSTGWTLNDSLTPRQDAVSLLLETLYEQKATQPVSINFHDEAIKMLSTNSTKVEIYIGDKKTNTFYVGQIPVENNATYMLTEGAKRPYVVKVPIQSYYIGVRYFTKLADWRDNKLLYKKSPIENIQISYSKANNFPYKIDVINDTSFNVIGNQTISKPLNKKRVNTYLGFLDHIYCYGFEETFMYKDTILKTGKQLGTIVVGRKNEAPQTLTIYFKPASQDTKGKVKIEGKMYDFDVFYGLYNNRDFLSIDKESVEKMFRQFPEFYEEDSKK